MIATVPLALANVVFAIIVRPSSVLLTMRLSDAVYVKELGTITLPSSSITVTLTEMRESVTVRGTPPVIPAITLSVSCTMSCCGWGTVTLTGTSAVDCGVVQPRGVQEKLSVLSPGPVVVRDSLITCVFVVSMVIISLGTSYLAPSVKYTNEV